MFSVLHYTFIKAADSLEFKFPGRKISHETNYGSSIVSSYLTSQREASEKFCKKFCEKFAFDFDAMKIGEVIRIAVPVTETPESIVEAATLKMLFNEIAQLKARVFGLELNDVTAKMVADTSSIIEDILKVKGSV